MTLICPNCQRGNREGAAFCDGCGGSLSAATPRPSGPQLVSGDRAFVGRGEELAKLANDLDGALAGNGRIVMVAGEPGIGKTRIAHRIAAEAKARGTLVLWGRCMEEPGAPPYWPWLQAIDGFALEHDDAALRTALGRTGAHIAAIVEPLADRLPDLPAVSRASNPDQARFQLFDALTSFWKRVAGAHGLLLVLDNLHTTDAASLRFLEFLASEISSHRIMVLGTYRDIELTRQHPLSNTLGELARHPWVNRLRLTGLNLPEATELVKTVAGREPPRDLVQVVFGQTEGNPLFLQEITRYLAHEGLIVADRSAGGGSIALRRIPEGIREVIGTRLNRLSRACNQVLSGAAVIGRAFRLDLLTRLDENLGSDACLAALEEAETARIVEAGPESGSYEFTHALIRETLYDELSAVQRARLHQRIGGLLATGRGAGEMATLAAIAHHHCAALPGGDAEKALEYARRAAERAGALFAYEEAVRLYRMALQASEARTEVDPLQRGALLVGLGESLTRAGEYVEAREVLSLAADAVRAVRTPESVALFARAAIGFETSTWRPGEQSVGAVRLLKEAVDLLAGPDSVDQARVLSALGRAFELVGNADEALRASDDAIAMARRLNHRATLESALRMGAFVRFLRPGLLDASVAMCDEAIRLADGSGDVDHAMESLTTYFAGLMRQGKLVEEMDRFSAFCDGARELRQSFYLYFALTVNSSIALLEGRFEQSERFAEEALTVGQRQPGIDAMGVYGVQMFSIRREQGRLREVAPVVRHLVATSPTSSIWRPGLALIFAEVDMLEDARREFDTLAKHGFAQLPRDALWVTSIGYLAEVCVFLADEMHAAALYESLLPYRCTNLVTGPVLVCSGSIHRYLGMLAATMKLWDVAEGHFIAAIDSNARQGARPWLAHTQHEYARMLVARNAPGDHQRAGGLVDEASAIGATLGMLRLTARLEALRATLGEASAQTIQQRELPAGLSPREAEVLRLVAIGRSNKEIAKVLSLSDNTVANHVRNILGKTGTANRTEAAAFARAQGLA